MMTMSGNVNRQGHGTWEREVELELNLYYSRRIFFSSLFSLVSFPSFVSDKRFSLSRRPIFPIFPIPVQLSLSTLSANGISIGFFGKVLLFFF